MEKDSETKGSDSNAQVANVGEQQEPPLHFSFERILLALNHNLSLVVTTNGENIRQEQIANKLRALHAFKNGHITEEEYQQLYTEIVPPQEEGEVDAEEKE